MQEENTPPPVTDLPPLVDENLNFSEGYQERIGEHAEGSTFKNLNDMFKTIKEEQSLIGQLRTEKAELTKKVAEGVAPPANPLPADAAAFKEQLKLPDLPEGMQLSPDILDKGIAYALEKGHGPEAFADFIAFDIERATLEGEAAKNAAHDMEAKAILAIQELTGSSDVETTLGDSLHSAQALNLPITREDMIASPTLAVSLAKLRTSLSEGTLKGASATGVEITSGGKLSQAKDIVSNSANPSYAAFHDDNHVGHTDAVQLHARLISESAL